MSKQGSQIDLTTPSANKPVQSSGYSADNSINDIRVLQNTNIQPMKSYNPHMNQQIQVQQQQHQQQQQEQEPNSFIENSFFYNLDQMTDDSSLFFMQQQQHQQQQQNTLLDQFLKNSNNSTHSNNASSSSLSNPNNSLSITTSMESFQNAVTTTVGEQPPSFWAGLNNFISNVTHTNIFPTIPNIARSFTEYLANHPVPFLSSFNANTSSPTSSPLPGNSVDFERMMQFKQEHDQINTGMQIRVLGVPQTGAKSRVETQIKLCIQLVTDGGDKAQWWSHLKLPEHMVTKDKLKRTGNSRGGNNSLADVDAPVNPEKMLYLHARVLCASDPSKKVVTCLGCVQRERKRSQRRKENKQQQSTDELEDEKLEEESNVAEEERILLFNCSEIVDFSAGDTILPTRITCYCRHHNEKLGFCIYFEMTDHTGKKVAEGISPPIMITDDHKSNKVKTGSKRRRTESEIVPEPRIPALSWIKSSLPLPFSGKTESNNASCSNNFPISSASSTTSEIEDMKSALKSMLVPGFMQQAQQQPQPQSHLYTSPQQPQSSALPPTMKRLIPNEAPTNGGIEITILGSNFRPGMTVMFGETPATNIQYWSPNTLICTLPPAQHPGAVVVSFKESPPTDKSDVMVFTYQVETDRALMELALQVIGMKMTGIVEDARKIAMRIVQGNNSNSNSGPIFTSGTTSESKESPLSKLMVKSEPSEPSLK